MIRAALSRRARSDLPLSLQMQVPQWQGRSALDRLPHEARAHIEHRDRAIYVMARVQRQT
jgi:hypothetical protein